MDDDKSQLIVPRKQCKIYKIVYDLCCIPMVGAAIFIGILFLLIYLRAIGII